LLSPVFTRAAAFEVVSSFYAPAESAPAGLAWDGATLWMTDGNNSSTRHIYQLNTDGTVVSSFDWPLSDTQGPSGITLDGDSMLRVAAWSAQKIYKFSTAGILESYFEAPIRGIRGITWDGVNLWLAGGGWPNVPEDVVHIYQMTIEGGVINSFDVALGTKFYRDLAFDGSNLWLISQSGDQNLFMISPEGVLRAGYKLSDDIGIPGTPRGLTWDGKHLWVACSSPNVIYQLKPVSSYPPVNEYLDVAAIPDMNDNGVDEIGCLFIDSETGSTKVLIKDGETKVGIKSIAFFSFGFSPKAMTVLPDMNENGFPEIAVLAINKVTRASILMVKDSHSKEQMSKFRFMGDGYIPSGISIEQDISGNGMPEITVIQINRMTGRATAHTRDAMTGEAVRKINFPLN
jgi:hypothetical protein